MSKVSGSNDRFEQLLRQLLAERKSKAAGKTSTQPSPTASSESASRPAPRDQDGFDGAKPPRR